MIWATVLLSGVRHDERPRTTGRRASRVGSAESPLSPSTSSGTGTPPSRSRTPSSPRSKPARRTTWPASATSAGRWSGSAAATARVRRSTPISHSSTFGGPKDPQAVIPVCAGAAHVYTELGDPTSARAPGRGVPRRRSVGGIGFGIASVQMLAWTLTPAGPRPGAGVRARAVRAESRGRGRRSRLPAATRSVRRTAWARSAPLPRRPTAVSQRPGRAISRQLEPALAFHRSVRATAVRARGRVAAGRVGLALRSAGTRRCGRRARCQSAMPPWSTGRASTPAAARTLAATAARAPLSQIVTTGLSPATAAP